MKDVSDRPRKFLVTCCGNYELVEVPAGKDADTVCSPICDELIGNFAEAGWYEADEEEIQRLKDELLL